MNKSNSKSNVKLKTIHNVYGQKYLHSSILIRPIATGISNQVPSHAVCITNICVCVCVWGGGGGGCRSEEHSKFKHGTVIGCPLCNKSISQFVKYISC